MFGQVSCIDTIYYPHSKMTAFNDFELLNEATQNREGISQAFDGLTGFANSAVIHGVNAFVFLDTNGIPGDAPSLDILLKVTNVDALNRPTTTIASELVTVTDIGTVQQTLMFTNPVVVFNRYAITIELNPATSLPNSDSLYYRTNDPNATPSDGRGEGLFAHLSNSGWNNSFLQFGSLQDDKDALLAPIYEKVIHATYTADMDTVCQGGDIVFSNTAKLDTLSMYNRWNSLGMEPWVWNYGDGTGPYNHFDTTYTFFAGGSYSTKLIITNYGYTNNCVDSAEYIIEVIDAVVASNDTSICSGDSVNLSATGAITYSWDNGLGLGQNQIAGPLNDTMFVVTGTGLFSCISTDTVNVIVNSKPSLVASTDTTICLGDTANISATSSLTSFDWDNGLGLGQQHQVAPNVLTSYVVSVVDLNGCSNEDTVLVSVNSIPDLVASVDTSLCLGESVIISATSILTNFVWDNGLGSGQQHQVSPLASTSYIVSVSDLNNCVGLDTVDITINLLPVLTTNSDTVMCSGDSLVLFVSGADTYIWDNGLGSGTSHVLLNPNDTTYMVEGTDNNGCISNDSVKVTVTVINVVASNDTSICLGTNATISAVGASSFSWDNGLGFGSSQEVSPEIQTTYIVTGDENGCLASDTVILSIDNMCFEIPNVFTPNGDGKNDVWNISGLELYPEIIVKIFNRWGDLVFASDAGYTEPWDGTYNGTVSPSATYYYLIDLGDGEEGSMGTINIVR
jgi:gliding motility-associated-like protein